MPGSESLSSGELGSPVAPHIGAVFEGSRLSPKVRTRILGVPGPAQYEYEVPVYKVLDREDRELWAFRNIHAFKEYTSPVSTHWYAASRDWILDIQTAKGRPYGGRELEGIKETEDLLRAMIAVSASVSAMEISAGSIESYIGALVGDVPDRADTWSDVLIHGDELKINTLKKNSSIKWFLGKLLKDVYECEIENGVYKLQPQFSSPEDEREGKINPDWLLPIRKRDAKGNFIPNLDCQLVKYIDKEKKPYPGGMREYVFDYLLSETPGERHAYADWGVVFLGDDNQVDEEVRAAAAMMATDLFLVDEYTQWEFDADIGYKGRRERDPASKKVLLWPTKSWGGNPLRSVLHPSFLPEVIKGVYGGDQAIMDWVDSIYTFTDAKRQGGEDFRRKFPIKPTMTTKLKAIYRYGQAVYSLFGNSTATSLPNWGRDQGIEGKQGIPAIAELLNQDLGRLLNDVQFQEEQQAGVDYSGLPYGKEVMGNLVSQLLYLKAIAAVRQFYRPGVVELMINQKDRRNMREIAEEYFGSDLRYTSGYLTASASGRLEFEYPGNDIVGTSSIDHPERPIDKWTVMERLDKAKNILCLSGEFGKRDKLVRLIQTTFGLVVGAVGGAGGKKK